MFSSLTDPIKITVSIFLGLIVGILVMLLVYEGISLPLVGQVINGRVANAVDEAREGYVLLAEKTAAEAKAAELQRQLTAAAGAKQFLEQQIQQDAADDAQREKERDDHILEMELRLSQANRRCTLSRDDLRDILRQ